MGENMPTCKFCGKQYDVNDSSANNYKQYCSRSCELRGISAAKDRENTLIAAEAADDQARAYYEAADAAREQADAERERADAEYERANAEYERANAEREKAKAYDRLRKSNERIEEERKAEEKKQREQELAREDLTDRCGMFVTARRLVDCIDEGEEGIWEEVKLRETTGGIREYKLGQCEVKEYPDEKSIDDGTAELVVHVNSLLNKTPKGTGLLKFRVYYLEENLPVPFEQEDSATGITYWGKVPDFLDYPNYVSDEFFLKQGENIEDRNFTLRQLNRTPRRLDSYNVFLTLVEYIGEYFEEILVAWTKIDTVDTFDNTLFRDFGGYYGKKGPATEFSGKFWYGGRSIHYGRERTINNKTVEKDFLYLDFYGFKGELKDCKSSASLYLKLTLTQFGTENVITWNRSPYFTLSSGGRLGYSFYPKDYLRYEYDQEFDTKAVYEAELKMYEVDAADGNGRCVHSENFYYYPTEGYKVIEGEELGEEFKGQKKLAVENNCGPDISIEGASYSIKDNKKVTIEIDRLENESESVPTGSLKICLEYETNGKTTTAATLYKNYLRASYHYNPFEQTVEYTRPQDYCDDSIPIISVFQLGGNKKWYREKAQVKFLSVNQQKQRDAEQKAAEERRIAEAKKQEAARKAAEAKRREQEKQEKIKKEKEEKAKNEFAKSAALSKKLSIVCYASFFLWFASYWSYRGLSDSFGNIISTLILSILIGGIPAIFLHDIGLIGIPVYFVWDLTNLSFVQAVLLTIILALPSLGLGLLIKKFVKGTKLYRQIAIITTAATVVIPIALIVFFKVVKH